MPEQFSGVVCHWGYEPCTPDGEPGNCGLCGDHVHIDGPTLERTRGMPRFCEACVEVDALDGMMPGMLAYQRWLDRRN